MVASCSSNGKIKLWNIEKKLKDPQDPPVAEYDAKCRLTCMTLSHLSHTYVNPNQSKTVELHDENASETEVEEPIKKKYVSVSFDKKPSEESNKTNKKKRKLTGQELKSKLKDKSKKSKMIKQ